MAKTATKTQPSITKIRRLARISRRALNPETAEFANLEKTHIQHALAKPSSAHPAAALTLQRMVGNRATTQLFALGQPFAPLAQRCFGCSEDKIQTKSTQDDNLGKLSERYESGGRGAGTVSGGQGDAGGASYGTYQMTSQVTDKKGNIIIGGTVKRFVNSDACAQWQAEFAGLTPGSADFTAKWKEIAARAADKDAFRKAQHEYIKLTHYDPLAASVTALGVNVSQRSATLRDVVWSTAVQHGAKSTIIATALAGKEIAKLSDEEIITAIYHERGREKDGVLVYFSRNSKKVQEGVKARFISELQVALSNLKKEQEGQPQPQTQPQTAPTGGQPQAKPATGGTQPAQPAGKTESFWDAPLKWLSEVFSVFDMPAPEKAPAKAPAAPAKTLKPATPAKTTGGTTAPTTTLENSGSAWVARFPTSRSVDSLDDSFKPKITNFLNALSAAGATYNISATYRPVERAYLMHYAWCIAKEGLDPAKVPAMAGVNIRWLHANDADRSKSKAAAQAMVSSYQIVHKPSLTSNHTRKLAIDVSISWTGDLRIMDGTGKAVEIKSTPRTGAGNAALHAVGATYGVLKLVGDAPHWSSNGR